MPTPSASAQSARFGPFKVDFRARELLKNDRRIRLQDQPLQVLAMLLEHPGKVVTREELRVKLWPADTFVDFDHGLNNAINRLRETLCDSAEKPHYIETLPRCGYRFVASVEPILPAAQVARAGVLSDLAVRVSLPGEASAQTSDKHGTPAWRSRVRGITFGAAVAAVLLAILLVFNFGKLRGRILSAVAGPRIQSITVLPFENLTGDPGQEYLVDGMTDELTTRLAQISSWKVISRTSAMQYKGVKKSLPQIAKELNVDAVVEGTVSRSGRRIRITAQLIQASTDRHLWADSYEQDFGDILSVQAEIARDVADRVRVRLTPHEEARLTQARPVDPGAYEDYLKGLYYLRKWTSEDSKKAIGYFQKAIQRNPSHASAYVGLAGSYWRLAFLGPVRPRDAFGPAETAARKAVELDESLGEAHASLAGIRYRYDWDWQGADAEFRRALELSPNSAESHGEYAVYLRTANRYQEAIDEAKRGHELEPLPGGRFGLGAALLIARRYDLAIQELRKGIALNPEAPLAHHFLGVAYEQQKKAPEAIAEMEQAVSLSHRDSVYYLSGLGHTYAIFGKRREATAILAELQQRAQKEYVTPYSLALVWLGLGDKPQAMVNLEKAYEDRSFPLLSINSWPWFDPLRSDPQFQDLVRRIGLDPQRAVPPVNGAGVVAH
jgi:TolB-like protein/DNA-binding winged helix-turn-helix (wHTH) protein/Flp pilus assembly protein TadD